MRSGYAIGLAYPLTISTISSCSKRPATKTNYSLKILHEAGLANILYRADNKQRRSQNPEKSYTHQRKTTGSSNGSL